MNSDESVVLESNGEVTNGASWSSIYLTTAIEMYGLYALQQCISIAYAIYTKLTFINLLIFLLKVPTGIYMYTFTKNIYVTSREKLKQKQMDLENIQLQIQITNTKISVLDAEFTEREELYWFETERLRRVRARVRSVIANDDTLQRTLNTIALNDFDADVLQHTPTKEDNEFTIKLLKSLKCDQIDIPERNIENMDCGDRADTDPITEQTNYSSLNDIDIPQDCRVKIVKVTNVFKVAYPKHYIKQNRLRRACKQTTFIKKFEKMLKEWQETLNMVINSNVNTCNTDSHAKGVQRESRPRDYSDSDSDNSQRLFAHNYEDFQDTAVSTEYYEQHRNGDVGNTSYIQLRECMEEKFCKMPSILEETSSHLAIREDNEDDCRDIVFI